MGQAQPERGISSQGLDNGDVYTDHTCRDTWHVCCLFSHITHVITLMLPGPRFVGLPIVRVFAHNNDWPGHQG